jgi:hypothetical protein
MRRLSNDHRSETEVPVIARQNLERLVSFHQLISYPSEHNGFNCAYEEALACVNGSGPVKQLYIVQYRTTVRKCGAIRFAFVPHELISSDGPCFLTDICGVARK